MENTIYVRAEVTLFVVFVEGSIVDGLRTYTSLDYSIKESDNLIYLIPLGLNKSKTLGPFEPEKVKYITVIPGCQNIQTKIKI